ncbi:hypothetical protein RJE46_24530 (plasmid) [Cedecea neteri]|uniref:hypothetical protein n=1 Tax=Cedecea neteri TaxID=158822 RepID=UPI002892B9BB|nr:hypothetical protein [Cedecea neteri]WNJ82246.1 hypothetical protein RJE46_24530 [Cedecea neteri]
MHDQLLRTYQVAFNGRGEKGDIPLHTRVKAVTAKGAIRAFKEMYKPVAGSLLGDAQDITEQVLREEKETQSLPQK